jgi:hypothetical protein
MRRPNPIVALCISALVACGRGSSAAADPTHVADLERRVQELERTLRAERESREAERASFAEERERATCDLADLRGRLTDREDEFLRTLQAVGTLAPAALPDGYVLPKTDEDAPDDDVEPPEDPALLAARARSVEHLRSLRNLLAIEDIHGLDLLELGLASDHGTGPVVFRTIDGNGRPLGSLYAERLRLEGSRAARSVTIVLEHGYELRGGVKTTFDGATDADGRNGTRRIQLVHVDPQRWIDALPELFGPKAAAEPDDDGMFDPRAVRETLNRLLALDAASGYYVLDDFAGTVGGVLRKVALRQRNRDGKLERMLFADRMRIEPEGDGVRLVLEDGAQMRGSEKAPFLDGRFRIFLPRADLAAWRAAGLPGLAPLPIAAADDETARQRE